MVAWSYSALNSFETCAYRHLKVSVKKEFREVESEAMRHGNRVHKAFELRVKDGTPLPNDLARHEPMMQRLLASADGGMAEAEQKMAINAHFHPTTYFAKDVWCRGITDLTIVKGEKAFIADYKTGQPTPESAQLRLTAAMTFAHKPWVNTIYNTFIWLKTDSISTPEVFQREDVPKIWQEFAPRVQRLELAHQENRWPKKPSGLCRKHCPVRDCEFHGG
jgi:hypothetical protein